MCWSDVVEKNPAEPSGWTALVGLAASEGDLEEASALLVEGKAATGGAAVLLQSEGLIRMQQGDLTAAEQALRAALREDGSLRKSSYNLMLLSHRQGRLDEAARIGSELVAEHPLYETAWNGLGAVYIDMSEPEAALEALERAYALNPFAVDTVTNLGNASFLLGDRDAAARRWQEVLRLDPDNDYARRGLDALSR